MSKINAVNNQKSIVDQKKKISKELVAKTLFFEEPHTVLQLSKVLNMSVPTSTILINELLAEKWICEIGEGEARSGRKPITFDVNKEIKKILVIEVTNQLTTFYLFNLKNEVIFEQKITIELIHEGFINTLAKEILDIKISHEIWGVGISVTGLIGKKDRKSYTYPTLNDQNQSLELKLEQLTQIPTFIIQNTVASILGENQFGLAKNKKDVLLLHLDWGLSLGIISNGDIVKGVNGFGGEIGHIQIYPNGKLCRCGKVGCLETVASASALLNKINEGLADGRVSMLQSKAEGITVEHIFEAIKFGDEFAIETLYEIGNELGRGVSIAVHLFNPELIIIDGLLSKVGNYLITSIEQALNKYCLSGFKDNLDISISPLGSKAKLLGVSSFVFCKMIGKVF